jgi:hypothetical protein
MTSPADKFVSMMKLEYYINILTSIAFDFGLVGLINLLFTIQLEFVFFLIKIPWGIEFEMATYGLFGIGYIGFCQLYGVGHTIGHQLFCNEKKLTNH